MNRHVLITGASRGIGAAIALAFARQGDHVGIIVLTGKAPGRYAMRPRVLECRPVYIRRM